MRVIRLDGCVVLACAAIAATASGEDFPYDAYVAVDGAEVVSGPGQRFYATDRLAIGTKVEVYREEASGWLAIRPPAGSFSWVDAQFIERSEDDDSLGQVTEPTPAWIGTATERVSEHHQHVMLKADEVVRILGEKQVGNGDGGEETWLKITPPAGEFRWIHLRDVSRHRPEPLTAKQSIEVEPQPEAEDPILPEEPRRFEIPRGAIALRDLAPVDPRAGNRRESQHAVEAAQFNSAGNASATGISPDGFVPRKRRGSEPVQPTATTPEHRVHGQTAQFTRPRQGAPPLATSATRSTISTIASSTTEGSAVHDVAGQLEQLDVELSLMLAKDKSSWDLAGLRQRVEELVERGTDPTARGQARLLLDKIKQFEQTFNTDETDSRPAAVATEQKKVSAAPSPADPHFDGKGWLKPVVSRRSEKPPAPFALVDADGKPVLFVTPSPGLNLNRYLNKQVGVYGRRGYIESLKASHVTAERVIDLGRHLR